MAPEKKDKKRKATSAAAVTATDLPNKKSKKTSAAEKTPSTTPKSILKKKDIPKEETNGIAKSTAPETATSEPARKIKPRKRASDFLSDDENDSANEEESKPTKKQSAKKSKETVEKKDKKDKKEASSKTKKAKIVEEPSGDDESEGSHDDEEASAGEDEIDDQTAELIKGFESSGDEDASEDEGFDADKAVPRIPDSKKAKRKIQKKLKESAQTDVSGTVYVGRIPHGFYEHQMKAYFSQFGDITRLRLSRNRVTGRSKHYAFIEFASEVVAKIVAETMNNYLMYGHILKCKFVPQEQQHADLWKGSNRRYKRVPWNKIEKQRLDRGKTRDKWAKSIEQEGKRRLAKAEKLKELLGYEYEVPGLKAVDAVPVQEKLPAPEAEAETAAPEKDVTTAIATVNGDDKETEKEAVVDEQTPKKKSKKAKKEKAPATPDVKTTPAKVTEAEQPTPSATPESSSKKAKAKKSKKSAGKA